jgi:hypothetical protein
MYRKVFKFMVLVLSILIANFITMLVDKFTLTYRSDFKPHVFTWIGMAVVIVIYYPLFTRIDKWSTRWSEKFIKTGKKVIGREIGAVIVFFALLFTLYYLYGRQWYQENMLTQFFKSALQFVKR